MILRTEDLQDPQKQETISLLTWLRNVIRNVSQRNRAGTFYIYVIDVIHTSHQSDVLSLE